MNGIKTMSRRRRVAVIGAGMCGLGAMKAFLEDGLEPTCFEKTGHIGGLWRYHDDDTDGIASVMKSTVTNTSKELGSLSDFPPPAENATFMHNTEMYEYIKSAAEKYGVVKYVKFYHETLKIEKAEDYEKSGRWKVTCRNNQTKDTFTEVFDCVAVCIGHHVHPNIPVFPGQEEFAGKIIHSHSLKTAHGFEDQNVVVVGASSSGMDAALELSYVAKQVYWGNRRGTWVLPKTRPSGLPVDSYLLRRPCNLAFRCLPYSLVCYSSEKLANRFLDHKLYNLKPNNRIWSQHLVISDILSTRLKSGAILTRKNIKRFTKHGVMFEGEEEETPADAVILATGYQVKFSFLSEDILSVKDNRVPLYKYAFPPDLPHPTLAIVGQIQPAGPGIPPGEMQCRWISRVMSGNLALPSREKMYKDIKKKDDYNRKRYTDSPRHTFEVDFIGFQEELAKEIGVRPNLCKLAITDPKLFWAIFFGPHLPYQYRLQGPHAWDGARNAILTYRQRAKAPLVKPRQEV